MTFKESLLTCLRYKIVNLRDRASRSEYWWFFLFAFALQQVIGFLTVLPGGMYLTIAILLYVGWAQIAVTVRRLHDLNYSGKWLWFAYGPAFTGIFLMIYAGGLDPETLAAVEDGNVPENDLLTYGSFLTIIGFVLSFGVMILCAKAGTVGDNRFGPDPLQQRRNARQYQGFGQGQSFGQGYGQGFGQNQQNQQEQQWQQNQFGQNPNYDQNQEPRRERDDGLHEQDPWAQFEDRDAQFSQRDGEFGFNANAPENKEDDSEQNKRS